MREDLEKSLTELTNLSISLYNSEVSRLLMLLVLVPPSLVSFFVKVDTPELDDQ